MTIEEIIALVESGVMNSEPRILLDAVAHVAIELGGKPDAMTNCSHHVAFVYLGALVARRLQASGETPEDEGTRLCLQAESELTTYCPGKPMRDCNQGRLPCTCRPRVAP